LTPGGSFDGSAAGSTTGATSTGAGGGAGSGGGGGGGGGAAGTSAVAGAMLGVRGVGGRGRGAGGAGAAAGAGGLSKAIDRVVCVGLSGAACASSRRTPVIASACISSTRPRTTTPRRQRYRPCSWICRFAIVCRAAQCFRAPVFARPRVGRPRAPPLRYRLPCHSYLRSPPMKLATLKDGSRDGQLVVVSRDLTLAHLPAASPAGCSSALDDWNFLAPQLDDLYQTLNEGRRDTPSRSTRASAWRRCRAPTSGPTVRPTSTTSSWCARRAAPRCRRVLDRPADVPGRLRRLLGPCDDPIVCPSEDWGIDFEAEVAVITGDVPMGTTPDAGRTTSGC
jgi:hypothetical protein